MNSLLPRASLEDLATFVAVAEAGSFSAAALRLRVSKAAVSVAVARLERQLGVRLLQRTTRRVAMTEAGAATLPHAQRALLAARDAEEAATSATSAARGLLRVHAPPALGLLHVAPLLPDFLRAHPEVQVDLAVDGDPTGFDVVLELGATARPGEGVVLAPGRRVLVASPAFLARQPRGGPRVPADLARCPALVHDRGAPWVLVQGDRTETVVVRGPLASSSDLALYTATLEGLGVAALPRLVVGADLGQQRLARVLPDWELPAGSVHARAQPSRAAQAFLEHLRAYLATLP